MMDLEDVQCLCQVAFELDGVVRTNPEWPYFNPRCVIHGHRVGEPLPFDFSPEEEVA